MSHRKEGEHTDHREILSEMALDDVFSAVVDVTMTLDSEGVIQAVTDDRPPTLGYRPAQVTGQSVTSLFASFVTPSPVFDVADRSAFRDTLLDEETETVTAPVETADGTVVALSLSTIPRHDGEGLVCLGRDVSESQTGDRATRLLDSIADPVCVLDSTGQFERVNDALLRFTGYEREELRGRNLAELLPRGTYEQATADVLDLVGDEDSESVAFEVSLLTKDGARILTEANVTALTDDQGAYAGAVGVLRDIDERKHRERNLTMLKQVLTRVFRHNVRNELLIAKGHTELLEEAVGPDLQTHTDKILETADRLLDHSEKARLIEQVIEKDETYEVDIATKARNVVDAAREQYPDARVDADLPAELLVEAHPDIASAIEELVENAIEHGPPPQQVDVWVDSRDRTQTLFVEDESGGLAADELSVLDRGSEHDLEHSSGVGLWLVRWLVEYSGAEMVVHQTDEGSLMGIRFGQQTTVDGPAVDLAESPAHHGGDSLERLDGEPLVGRVDALNRLEDTYESLARTGGHSVLLTGEAGVGKTTLVEQFCGWLSGLDDPPVVARGACDPESRSPYYAFQNVVDDLPTDRDSSALFTEATTLSVEGPDELGQRKSALFADLADELRGVAVDRPVVLVVEDMQWADRATIDLFEYLTAEVGQWSHPVLFVGTYRTSDVDQTHPVLRIADETASVGRGTVVELDPFDQHEVESLLAGLLSVEDVPTTFVEAVHEHTGGTPLFVSELGRQLRETLGPTQSGAALPETLEESTVPETVESAVGERLDVLPDDVTPALRLAAVAGREFSFDVLRAASDQPVDALIDYSNTLVRRQVWRKSAETIEFIHGVLRQQTLNSIPDTHKERLHARVADAIETVYADDLSPHAARLGPHYEQTGEFGTAFEYYRQAGEHAAGQYAQTEAIEQYEKALAIGRDHDAVDQATVAAVCRELGKILRVVGEYDRARERYRESLEACESADDPAGRADSLTELGHILLRRGEYDQARECYQEGREIAQETDNLDKEASALTGLGVIETHLGNHDQARTHHQRTLEIRRETGDREGQSDSLNNLGILADYRGDYETAREYHQRSLEIKRDIGDRRGEANSLGNLGIIARLRGEFDRAEQYHQQSLAVREEIGDRKGQANSLDNLGIVAESRGEYEQSLEYHERSLEIERELGNRRGEAESLDSLGTVCESTGEYDRAREYHQQSLSIREEIGDRKGAATSRHNLGMIDYYRGDYDKAQEYHEQSLALRRELEYRNGEADSLNNLGLIASARGDHEQAEAYYRESLEIREEIGDRKGQADSLGNLGLVARRRGAYDTAEQYYQQSLEMKSEIGDRQGQARSLDHLGVVARHRGNYDTAREYYQRSLDIKTAIGDRHGEAVSYNNLGIVWQLCGEYDRAKECYQQSYEEFQELRDRDGQAHTLKNLGKLARRRGQYEEATSCLSEALDIAGEDGFQEPRMGCLRELAAVARHRDEHDRASTHLEKGVALCDAVENPEERVKTHLERARLALSRGVTGRAREALDDATQLLSTVETPHHEARADLLAGRLAAATDSPVTACEHCVDALEGFEDVGAPQDALRALELLVETHQRQGNDDQAAEYRRQAEQVVETAPASVEGEWLDSAFE